MIALFVPAADLSEPNRRRPPTGLTTTGPVGRFAVRDGFYLVKQFPHPRTITTARFVGWCADRLAPFGPVHRWLASRLNHP